MHGRDEARAQAVADGIGAAAAAIGDLATDAGAVAAAAGEIDVLVNNAGVCGHVGRQDATPDVWRDIYETNVLSAVRMIQRFVPGMRARGRGRVVQIGGGLGSQPIAIQPHCGATLAARHSLAVSLAPELEETGVTSNVVSPGAIMVDSVREWLTNQAPANGWARPGRRSSATPPRSSCPAARRPAMPTGSRGFRRAMTIARRRRGTKITRDGKRLCSLSGIDCFSVAADGRRDVHIDAAATPATRRRAAVRRRRRPRTHAGTAAGECSAPFRAVTVGVQSR
ncbi:SDR family NAD(P)-dependent oxidoreductase [Lentzea flaviverrucosa]|uniref:Short chain dehydrogenase n=1 Tax=Lentzea flaviverrucosa TaxID=200379 RepID=A0A1H9GV99_9PSEU|nr:SDR family NAD(P)-dependent oxidoreductase [Lentzea flaviverrucosa]RDI34788.1 short subunit dehydrogenase [Lentzea flaviverrucosa]SEQ53985.1 short chain dehydrogenase [Lentzea flaviverrucosa]